MNAEREAPQCPVERGIYRCCYRLGHDVEVFAHRLVLPDEATLIDETDAS